MMENNVLVEKVMGRVGRSATAKLVAIGLLVMVLLIPTVMISSLIHERESTRDKVVREISGKWGGSQCITGPFLSVPYTTRFLDKDGEEQQVRKWLHILPTELVVQGELAPERRYRGIYEAVLYSAELRFSGSFRIPSLEELALGSVTIDWEKACFAVGISELRGVRKNIRVLWGQEHYDCHPGLKTRDVVDSGVGTIIGAVQPGKEQHFSFPLAFNGSGDLNFVPLGETTTVELKAPWQTPSFSGAFLPDQRTLSAQGFAASWQVLHLNRPYPQQWTGAYSGLDRWAFGLKLLVAADAYQKITRVAKYAILFIVFTFAAFFIAETMHGFRIHAIQYILVGLGILIFYVLLLALAEHVGFHLAYGVAALAVTGLITGYARGMVHSPSFTHTTGGVLAILYAFLYLVLQLEDYALLIGSLGLFAVLGGIMYVTRHVDWYALGSGTSRTLPVPEERP